MSVWVTRSAPDNLRTARALHALGLNPLIVPAITTVATHRQPVTSVPDAIIFTSVHAVRHFAWHAAMASVPVIVASAGIAEAALAAGYLTVTSVGGNESALIGLLGHLLRPTSHVLLICGVSASMTLAERLCAMAYRVERQVVYQPVPASGAEIDRLSTRLERVSAIVLHSCCGARRIVPVLQAAQWQGSLWCISRQTAQICSDLRGVSIAAAAQPSEASLLEMIACHSPRLVRRRPGPSRQNAEFVEAALVDRGSRQPFRRGMTPDNDNLPGGPDKDDPGAGPRAA